MMETRERGEEETRPKCTSCNGSQWIVPKVPVGHPKFGQAAPCPECRASRPGRNRGLERYSNLGGLLHIRFDNSNPEGPLGDPSSKRMYAGAISHARRYAEAPEGWLTLTGPPGAGKTHLAAAITNRCTDRGQPCLFMLCADLLDHLRATYTPNSETSYNRLFKQVQEAQVLVLDDIGSHAGTYWASEKLFQLVNHRYNAKQPTIFTIQGSVNKLQDLSLRTRIGEEGGLSRVIPLARYNRKLTNDIGTPPPGMLARMTLHNFDPKGGPGTTSTDRRSLREALGDAQAFAEKPARWLLLTGPHGTGKTHLAVGIVNQRLKQEKETMYAFVPSLMDHLRATFGPQSGPSYDDLFEQLCETEVLVLDDLGSEHSTPWAEDKLFQIIAVRYDRNAPTVVTTSLTMTELEQKKPKIHSRLNDQPLVNWAPIIAPDYRQQRRENHGQENQGRLI